MDFDQSRPVATILGGPVTGLKIVLVCRHFPPAVSGGARRPFLLAKALEKAGCQIVVVAPQQAEGVSCVVVPHPMPAPSEGRPGRASLKGWLRTVVLLPDADIRWALRAGQVSLPWVPDWVLTTSPPESSHVAGWLIKRRFGCRWVVDMRDHWLAHPLLPVRRHPLRRLVERALAWLLLSRADAGVGVLPSNVEELMALGLRGPGMVVQNFASVPERAGGNPSERFSPASALHVVHTGSFVLSDPERRLETVLKAFEAADSPNVHLHLVGRLRDDEKDRVEESPLRDRIHLTGPVSMAAARAFQAAADVLLLVASPGTPHVPGKMAEYRTTGKPVLIWGQGPWTATAGVVAVADLSAAFASLGKGDLPPPLPEGLTADQAADALLSFLLGRASGQKPLTG